jgi:hypothetical protein
MVTHFIQCRPGHHPTVRPYHPPTFIFINNDGHNLHFPALSFARFCWYPANLLVDRGGVGIAIFGGIEPMPAKNDTYFRHLKAGEKDDKRSGPTPLHARH